MEKEATAQSSEVTEIMGQEVPRSREGVAHVGESGIDNVTWFQIGSKVGCSTALGSLFGDHYVPDLILPSVVRFFSFSDSGVDTAQKGAATPQGRACEGKAPMKL